jgi:hypothetical protein
VSISDASNPHDVMDALHGNYNTQLQSTGRQTGYVLARSLCAPVGTIGQFPANDYMCGSIIQSTSNGQDTYGLMALYNVQPDGTVYFVGSPCEESTPASGCDANYWNLVTQQSQVSAAPAPPTPTQTTSATSCGPFDVPGGNPSHYTNITVTGTSCAVGHAMAMQDALGPSAPRSTIGEGWTCGGPPEDSDPRLEAQCNNGSAQVDLYASTS